MRTRRSGKNPDAVVSAAPKPLVRAGVEGQIHAVPSVATAGWRRAHFRSNVAL